MALHIVDRSFDGLSEVLAQIGNHNGIEFSKAVWRLLVKLVNLLPSEEWRQHDFFRKIFQGTYRWFHQKERQKSFGAAFYRQLKKKAWLPDEQGNLHFPHECFVPTSKNQEILGDSVTYLHSGFNMSTRSARWLAEQLGIHLQADADGVLDYLQTMRQTGTSIEKIEPIYRFLESEGTDLWRFEEEPLIFTPEPEPCWWRTDKVFWEDESPVFGDDRGYLKAHYSENLKSFFTDSLGIAEDADTLDYARGIQDIASKMQAGTKEIRDRVQELYRRLWLSLQENEDSWEGEEWQEEWEQIREDACWLGKKGSEWDFFYLHKLVWKDDDYRSRLFKDEIPFWMFDSDLLEFAKYLGVNGCYEISDVKVKYYSDQGGDQIWSEKVQNLYPYIYDFLNSPLLCEQCRGEQAAEILERLSVHRAQRLEVRYRLNGAIVPDPNPRQSFLDQERGILWLGLEEDEEAYPDLIGDALQDDFRIDQLREFVKDLLPVANLSKTALLNWERRGFQADICLSPPEPNSKESDKNASESVDEKRPDEKSVVDYSGTDDSEFETPMIHEEPETENENDDSTEDEPETATYQPRPGESKTRSRGGKAINTPNGNQGIGHNSRHGSGKEDDTHMGTTDTSSHDRKEVEHAGMKRACRHEKKEGRNPKDVSSESRGYDIHSTSPDGKNRCIEVKARDGHGFVGLTSKEWSVAQQLKDNYFLYVVLNARTQPELYIIQNPADVVRTEEQIDVRYQVPLSEITEHGIRV